MICSKSDYLPDKGKWLTVLYEADNPNPDPYNDRIVVLDVEVTDTEEAGREWAKEAVKNRSWETRQ
jgi:hypothetical protein